MWVILAVGVPAHGWDQKADSGCVGGFVLPPSGTSHTWHMSDIDSDWDAAMENAIEDAFDQWEGGAGQRNRGYDWDFVEGSTQLLVLADGHSQLQDFPRSQMDAWGIPSGAVGKVFREYTVPACVTTSFDIAVIDTDSDPNYSFEWTTNPQSWSDDANYRSLPMVLIHEIGHGMALNHVFDLAVMEAYEASEIGGKFRINEDEYAYMRSVKGDSSTGKNFMLSKYVSDDTADRDQYEAWNANSAPPAWEVSAGDALPVGDWNNEVDGPAPIAVIVNGTASSYSNVPVIWTLSSDFTCFDGDDIEIGSRMVNISTNLPYVVGPSGGQYDVPASTPATQLYWLCAGIDPDGTLSESDRTDNVIISERLIRVVP